MQNEVDLIQLWPKFVEALAVAMEIDIQIRIQMQSLYLIFLIAWFQPCWRDHGFQTARYFWTKQENSWFQIRWT